MTRFALSVLLAACGTTAIATTHASAPEPASSATIASATPSASEAIADAPIASASASVVVAPPPPPPSPKVVLHLGDSMVGGPWGLSKALEAKFKALGSKFVRDWQVSLSILTFDHQHALEDLLAKYSPDLVILTLGANDVFVPFPSSLASSVRSIAHKMSAGGRACYWMAPPIWKKDTGIVDVIKKNAEPCKVFDASYMKIARAGDGIHPTDRGGVEWADGFFAFYSGTGPATPNEPEASP